MLKTGRQMEVDWVVEGKERRGRKGGKAVGSLREGKKEMVRGAYKGQSEMLPTSI